MKVVFLISLLTISGVLQANNLTGQELSKIEVSLNVKDASLKEALRQLEKESHIRFTYKSVDVAGVKNITREETSRKLDELLDELLKDTGLNYEQASTDVVIIRKSEFNQSDLQLSAIPPVSIRGIVTDDKGQPLPGVSVTVRGTTNGTTTKSDGSYSLSIQENSGVLVFSFIGFVKKEVSFKGAGSYNVALAEDVNLLNEVVVTGYVSQARKDVTGAIGTVNVDDLQKAPVRSFEEALAGRVAGVQVTSQDGQPGSGINILIRGLGSITQDSSPLFVIDGFPIDDPNNNAIDPNTVESISVLKDASATAIYGARGSNGVIVITTKRGQKGAPKISYSGNYGVNAAPNYIKVLNPFQFVQLQSQGAYTPGVIGAISNAALPWFRDGRILEDYRNSEGIDWQGEVLRSAPQNLHSISLTGGNDKTLYSISGNIADQMGIVIASDYRRYQAKTTLDQYVNDKFKVGLSASFANLRQRGARTTGNANSALFWHSYSLRPAEVAGLETSFQDVLYDPELQETDLRINPVTSVLNAVNNNIENNLNGLLYGEYSFTKNLKLKTEGGVNYRIIRTEIFNNSRTQSGGLRSSSGVNGALGSGQITQSLFRTSLAYNKTFNNAHKLNVFGAFEVQTRKINNLRLAGFNIINEELGLNSIETGTLNPSTSQTLSSSSSSGLVSGLTQLNYNYKGKYYVTASVRADGSSRFSKENRWGYFPSGSVKWKLSEENFIKSIAFLSDANIRASFGATGNNNVNDYARFSQVTFRDPLLLNNSLQPNSAVVTTMDNPDLTWEKAEQFDTGIDLGFFKNRLSLSVDYYKKNISDLLFNANLRPSSGYSTVQKNIGKISNRGFEFTVTSNPVKTRNFSWNNSFNITFNRNRLEGLSTPEEEAFTRDLTWESNFNGIDLYIAKLGQPLGQIYGLISEGLYQLEDFDRTASGGYVLKPEIAGFNTNMQPGDPKYRDIDKNGVINELDRVVIGRGYPIHMGGFSNNFKYKGFDMNVFFQWSYGAEVVNANRLYFESGYSIAIRPGYNQFASSQDRWSIDNQDATVPRFAANYLRTYSTEYVEDASFIRLKTVNFGYTFPKDLLRKIKVSNLRVFVAGTNLYTLTKYKGYDPEVSTFSSGLTPGMDWSSYPRAVTITGGVNLQF